MLQINLTTEQPIVIDETITVRSWLENYLVERGSNITLEEAEKYISILVNGRKESFGTDLKIGDEILIVMEITGG